MIEARDLHKRFGSFEAVRTLSLSVAPGEVVALLGPNGAGKTTTVRMLGAILKPTSGSATVAGYDVATQPEAVRAVVGLLTEFPGLYNRMQPMEYLRFFGELQGMPAAHCAARAEALLKQFGLWEARGKKLDSFSKGMKQKASLIRALLHDPPVLYLDEPTTAMDPHSARIVRDAMLELRAARRTILLTTHNLAEAEDLADRIVIIRGGAIIAEGTIAELTRQFMGQPIWEVETAVFHPDAEQIIADLVPVKRLSPMTYRYRTADAHALNPQLLLRLAEQRVPVVALAEVPRRLEDVYLQIVADHDVDRGDWSDAVQSPGDHLLGALLAEETEVSQ